MNGTSLDRLMHRCSRLEFKGKSHPRRADGIKVPKVVGRADFRRQTRGYSVCVSKTVDGINIANRVIQLH